MLNTPKKPNIIQISLSPSHTNISHVSTAKPNVSVSKPKKTFNPFIRQPPVSEISLYESTKPDDSSKKESNYDEIIQNLERKFEGLLLENRQLTEEMNSLSDQSSIDLRQVEFVSVESLAGFHRETQSIDFQNSGNGFVLQKAMEEKAKMEASLLETVNNLKNEKKRLKSELSLKKQEVFHLEKCITTHKDKKVYEISLRNNDENTWRKRYYELQKTIEKRNKEFEEIERSYQQKIKECYNEMERLRVERRKPENLGVNFNNFNDVEMKLQRFDSKFFEMVEYIKELEGKLREKERKR